MRTVSLLLLTAPLLALSVSAKQDVAAKKTKCDALTDKDSHDSKVCQYELSIMELENAKEDAITLAKTKETTDINALEAARTADVTAKKEVEDTLAAELNKDCTAITDAAQKTACEARVAKLKADKATPAEWEKHVTAMYETLKKDVNTAVAKAQQAFDNGKKNAEDAFKTAQKAAEDAYKTASGKLTKPADPAIAKRAADVEAAHKIDLTGELLATYNHHESAAAKAKGFKTPDEVNDMLLKGKAGQASSDAKKKVNEVYDELIKVFNDKATKHADGKDLSDDDRKKLKEAAEKRKGVFGTPSSAAALAAGGLAAAAAATVVFTLL